MTHATQGALELGAASMQVLPLECADVRFQPHWLDADEADGLFAALIEEMAFEQHHLRLFGREVAAPRLSCWVGDPDATYRYSGTRLQPKPWTPALRDLRQRIEAACDASFNSVLANLYRDGDDAMGWHSDDEPELGSCPVIASLSLGATRRFRLRRRDRHAQTHMLELPHGSLLYMAGATQRYWQHAVPRTRRVAGSRLNLTFRHIR